MTSLLLFLTIFSFTLLFTRTTQLCPPSTPHGLKSPTSGERGDKATLSPPLLRRQVSLCCRRVSTCATSLGRAGGPTLSASRAPSATTCPQNIHIPSWKNRNSRSGWRNIYLRFKRGEVEIGSTAAPSLGHVAFTKIQSYEINWAMLLWSDAGKHVPLEVTCFLLPGLTPWNGCLWNFGIYFNVFRRFSKCFVMCGADTFV